MIQVNIRKDTNKTRQDKAAKGNTRKDSTSQARRDYTTQHNIHDPNPHNNIIIDYTRRRKKTEKRHKKKKKD